jgi:hypothetical protein
MGKVWESMGKVWEHSQCQRHRDLNSEVWN